MTIQTPPSAGYWCAADILAATNADLICGNTDTRFNSIGIDSRTLPSGALFWALAGPNHDGHRFIDSLVKNGLRCVVIDRAQASHLPLENWRRAEVTCIGVTHPIDALGALAHWHRRRMPAKLIGLTGSCGKTTTKELVAAVLAQKFSTLATPGNLNNQIGLPLTLFQLRPAHHMAVVELGMNHAGEINQLASICRPDMGLITNIGSAHIGNLGSRHAIVQAKGELLARLTRHHHAILNANDAGCLSLASKCPAPITWFGNAPRSAIQARDIVSGPTGNRFKLQMGGQSATITLALPGQFMVANALAAAAVGHVMGLTIDAIAAGLQSARPISGRMRSIHLKTDAHLIDDAYNANPESMQAALTGLAQMGDPQSTIAVLGDMRELGNEADVMHRQIGAFVAAQRIDRLYVTGTYGEQIASGARQAGMTASKIVYADKSSIGRQLIERMRPGQWILVKGSRAMAMETIVQALTLQCGRHSSER